MPVHLAVKVVHHGSVATYHGIAKLVHAVHHALAAHALEAALAVPAGGAAVATVAYLDHEHMKRWYSDNPPEISIDRAVKIAIGGKLINAEFRTIATNEKVDTVLQGYRDKVSGELLTHRFIKAKRFAPDLAEALAGGKALVY